MNLVTPARGRYLNKSSNACRALGGPDAEEPVSRSTFRCASKCGHVFRSSFGLTRAAMG